jgi:arylsulfatase A-like enzyme
VISEQSTGFPGYNSIIAKDKATIGRILLENGYATSWFGKNHNTPVYTASQVGPFDQWPIGMGFEYSPGTWNLVTGMADDAIDWMTRMHQTDPSKPIFIKYAPGATHAPHHPTKEWVDRISAMHLFDEGWNQGARAHLRESEAAWRDPEGHQAVALAEGRAEGVGPAHGRREEALHPSG